MHIYRVNFINQGKIYEIHAGSIGQSEVYGFIEVSELIFGETSSLVIDPMEEKLKSEFGGVNRTLIPIHSVIRIDEVEKKGQNKIHDIDEKTNITPFPNPMLGPGKESDS
ncbi:MAG: DUF1820 family protein [Gammaproteobacteria bacterium]|nr:DUF1820 family protein [Gammaproteobacteria bacterium]